MRLICSMTCLILLLLTSCADDLTNDGPGSIFNPEGEVTTDQSNLMAAYFGENIDLDDLENYADQSIPNYIDEDNTRGNPISNIGATLGRILFYDVNLSSDNSTSCASCHDQSVAFGDVNVQSQGVNGLTGRHSMRLVNARFSEEVRFFWDERAANLEDQSTQPIQDHIEMGFSGTNGDPSLDDLIAKLSNIEYYPILFEQAFGSSNITEQRMQDAIAQFVRSIQSFDSRYDQGRAQVNNRRNNFGNFTAEENLGKRLFLDNRNQGGANCETCHQGDEFSIDNNSDNNGVIGTIGSNMTTLNVTKSPTLRDLFNSSGQLNGPLMHDGSLLTMEAVIDHYDDVPNNPELDNRLRQGGQG